MPLLDTISISDLQPKMWPDDARTMAVSKVTASTTLAKGTLVGKVAATGALAAYNNALSNGTETAVGIIANDVITDASGNIYLGTSAVPSSLNPPVNSVAIYVVGTFDTADLVGYDAPAGVDLGAKTLVNGYIRIP